MNNNMPGKMDPLDIAGTTVTPMGRCCKRGVYSYRPRNTKRGHPRDAASGRGIVAIQMSSQCLTCIKQHTQFQMIKNTANYMVLVYPIETKKSGCVTNATLMKLSVPFATQLGL